MLLLQELEFKPSKTHCGVDVLSRLVVDKKTTTIRDGLVDAELFGVDYCDDDTEWYELNQYFLSTSTMPSEFSTYERKALIIKSIH